MSGWSFIARDARLAYRSTPHSGYRLGFPCVAMEMNCILRGGSCCDSAPGARSAFRVASNPGNRFGNFGFRCVVKEKSK